MGNEINWIALSFVQKLRGINDMVKSLVVVFPLGWYSQVLYIALAVSMVVGRGGCTPWHQPLRPILSHSVSPAQTGYHCNKPTKRQPGRCQKGRSGWWWWIASGRGKSRARYFLRDAKVLGLNLNIFMTYCDRLLENLRSQWPLLCLLGLIPSNLCKKNISNF